MDKFWEKYITTRPVNSKGAFDEFVKMNQEPRNMADGGRIGFAKAGLVTTYPERNIQKIYNPRTKGTTYRYVGSKPNKSFSGPNAFEKVKAFKKEFLEGKKTSLKSLGKDFEKFFQNYLDKKSKIKIGATLKGSTQWPLMEQALAGLPKNASLEDKYKAIRDFTLPGDKGRRIGTVISATIRDSFDNYKRSADLIDIKDLAKYMPKGYAESTLLARFGDAKKDLSKYTGYQRNNIINSRNFVNNLKEMGLEIVGGEASGQPYQFKKPNTSLAKKLNEIQALRPTQSKTVRQAIIKFSKASEDYRKFGFSKSATALEQAADELNRILIDTFTDGKIPLQKGGEYSAVKLRNANLLNSIISEDNAKKLRTFINNNKDLKNKLSFMFDPEGKQTGNFFKIRDLNELSPGQLLRDLTIEKDHIFPLSEVEDLGKGKFGKGAALMETPFNKVASLSYVNNSLRNNIQNYLRANPNDVKAIKQIDNFFKSIDTPIYVGGEYLGGTQDPIVKNQILKMGMSDLELSDNLIKKLTIQEEAMKGLKGTVFKSPEINDFKKTFSQTFQDLSPQSVIQLARKHKCKGFNKGGSVISCLQTKFKKDPQGFLQRSAPLAADGKNANLIQWFKKGRNLAKLARGTGVLALWEAAFAPFIAAPMVAKGESSSRILNEIAYGVPFIGETKKEELQKYLGDDPYKLNRLMEIEGEEVPTWDPSGEKYKYKPGELDFLYGNLGSAKTISDAIKKSKVNRGPFYIPSEYNVERVEDKIKKTEQESQKLFNELGLMEGPAGKYYNRQKIADLFDQRDKGLLDLSMDKNKRRRERIELGIVADPNWYKQERRTGRMGGGMVGIRKPSAIPPESGPQSQGLASLKKYGSYY